MTDSILAKLADTVAEARSKLAKLRAAADEGAPLAKVADLIGDLDSRLTKLEASTIEAARTAPIPRRRKG